LGSNGHVKLQWELDGDIVWEEEFSEAHMASMFDLDIMGKSRLTLHGNALTDYWLSPDNNIVLADPLLIRKSEI